MHVAAVNHTTEVVLVAHLAFHELQQLGPGKMKLSGHEPQQMIVEFPLPGAEPSVNTRTAAADHEPQHSVVGPRIPNRLDRVEEIQDLFRKLFFEEHSITLQRLLWERECRLAVLVLAAKESGGGPEPFVVTLGECATLRTERERYRGVAPSAQGAMGTLLTSSEETTHYGANRFGLLELDPTEIESIEALYRRWDRKAFERSLKVLFSQTLKPWHRDDSVRGEHPADVLYRERLAIGAGCDSCVDLQKRVESLVDQSRRLTPSLTLHENELTLVAAGKTFHYPNPVPFILHPFPNGVPVRVHRTPGTFSGSSVLCHGSGKAWVTDFFDAGTAPPFWEFTCIEAMVRYDWMEVVDLAAIRELERGLTTPGFVPLAFDGDEPQLQHCRRAVGEIREAARNARQGDDCWYHWGMFFHAA